MIEQALYFAIGFLVALLAAVFAAPVVSRRAVRLAGRRARTQTPMTEERAAADRDVLLAAHAVELARLERRLAIAEDNAAGLRAITGRQWVRMITLETDAAERESVIFDMRSELDREAAERRSFLAAVTTDQIALHDAFIQRDRARDLQVDTAARVGQLMAEASWDRARIAISVARTEHLEVLLSSAEAAKAKMDESIVELTKSLAAHNRRIAELEDQLRGAARDGQDLRKRFDRAEVGQEEAARQLAELDGRLRQSERIREEMLIEKARQLAALADREAELRAARTKAVELEARFAAASEKASVNPDAPSFTRAQSAVAEIAGTEDLKRTTPVCLEALRRENDSLRARFSMPAIPQDAVENAALRNSIECFGWEAIRLFARWEFVDRLEVGPTKHTLPNRHDIT